MTKERVHELMNIELQCIKRNIAGCDRNCVSCDLVQKDEDLLEAYRLVILMLEDKSVSVG